MSSGRAQRIRDVSAPLLVAPGSSVRLPDGFDPAQTVGVHDKKSGRKLLEAAVTIISDEQRKLAAENGESVLLVIQALDAGGKDGTIRHVFSGVNPAGVKVHSFKQPTDEELDHDYLWRYRRRLPGPGEISVFNRSHYEEVLVVRVHPELLETRDISPREEIWNERFAEINDWERELSGRGVRIVKLLLNISNEEQRIRFLRRCDLPEKNWKFSAADIREREHWDEYQDAFSEMLFRTSTEWAPWYVIPADHKWFARLASAGADRGASPDRPPHPAGRCGATCAARAGPRRAGGAGTRRRARRPGRRAPRPLPVALGPGARHHRSDSGLRAPSRA